MGSLDCIHTQLPDLQVHVSLICVFEKYVSWQQPSGDGC